MSRKNTNELKRERVSGSIQLSVRAISAALLALMIWLIPLGAQTNTGELRFHLTDPTGLAVKGAIRVRSQGNEYSNTLSTDENGNATARRLPFGSYVIDVNQPGFAEYQTATEVRSALPQDVTLKLSLEPVASQVTVAAESTLLNPDEAGNTNEIGSATIESRVSSLPGRSLQDLVNSQPGWLYEGNAVLHPRGSEYQTQFIVDGIPLQDNRSPSFGPELEADDVDSLRIYTAGIPAEYGRKMGGVVEVNTIRATQTGFHGQAVLSGGSFDTAGAFFEGQYAWGKNVFGGSASGDGTAHYLNPVVPQNYTNRGTTGDFSLNYQRDVTANDRVTMSVRHELSRFELPNEQVQEAAGQLQTADNFETMGIVSYEHVFSSRAVADVHAMVRDNANDFYSNANSTPVAVTQHNWFRQGYVRAAFTLDRGLSEWKAGLESDNTFLNENTAYSITDPDDCGAAAGDGGTPCTFAFAAHRPDLEQSMFVQDLYHAGSWTINAGVRWDHYQLILNRRAVDPRFAISRYFAKAGLLLHFSYDRVFQTPSSDNLLLSSSPAVDSIDPGSFLRLPVEPSGGNYYEAGLSKAFAGKLRLDANYFRRLVNNYSDDDQIDNTTISFPIAFRKSVIYGAEAKLDLQSWRGFSGFVSYSWEVGNVWNPVTGGLFLGDDAAAAESQLSGHFPDSQDQRNTVRGRLRYQVAPRLWVAGGIQYDTGLPFEFDGDPSTVLEEYGQQVLNRINFDRGRIRPSFQVNASLGADLLKLEKLTVHFQADGENLTNVLDVIDFGGLFSGNAIGPSRSFAVRLGVDF